MAAPILEVTDVSLAFGGLQALSKVSLSVKPGSIVGLIGPNGAGKTTTLNVISGLQPADTGSIVFDGEDLTNVSAQRRAAYGIRRSFQNLGLVGDQTAMVNLIGAQYLTAGYRSWETLLHPLRCRAEEARLRSQALAAAQSFDLENALDERVADLSFATARFVELAGVLAGEPRMMLLDEPTTGLDLHEVDRLAEVLEETRSKGTTILLVAHDVRFVMRVCDYVYVLAEGQVLFHSEPSAVQRHPAVIDAYLGRSA